MDHDPDSTPYLVHLDNFPANGVFTLANFKQALPPHLLPNRTYRFYFKNYDQDVKSYVKEEILEEQALLPIFQGKVTAYVSLK